MRIGPIRSILYSQTPPPPILARIPVCTDPGLHGSCPAAGTWSRSVGLRATRPDIGRTITLRLPVSQEQVLADPAAIWLSPDGGALGREPHTGTMFQAPDVSRATPTRSCVWPRRFGSIRRPRREIGSGFVPPEVRAASGVTEPKPPARNRPASCVDWGRRSRDVPRAADTDEVGRWCPADGHHGQRIYPVSGGLDESSVVTGTPRSSTAGANSYDMLPGKAIEFSRYRRIQERSGWNISRV